uniref:Precorrin-6Y C5,15-methyltransferase (Decarboxylating) n=1 Tax=Candidatus Kentrum sp. SD TaxID=2126332 RepID=A0A451BNE0_9GAMM|nr:MAG: precorrin-6Y C5,15-methyltransferase (decarboxylating) [Candidatus Kentron sp. SD]
MIEPCHVIGILDDGAAGLNPAVRDILTQTDLVIGADRLLTLMDGSFAPEAERHSLSGRIAEMPNWIIAARKAGQRVAVLATGDPLCHGVGHFLIRKLGREALVFHPAPSTLQIACARLGLPWISMRIVSVHRGSIGEWTPDAGPDHGYAPLLRACRTESLLGIFTSPKNTPGQVARTLVTAGLAASFRITVAERLLRAEERVIGPMPMVDAAGITFADPNVVILERIESLPGEASFGLPDEHYRQRRPERGLITAREVRVVALARLAPRRDDIIWDIGAGSGSVGLEVARFCRHLFAVEKNPEDAAIVRENRSRMGIFNHTLLEAHAPAGLSAWPDPDAIFIGGSGGNLVELMNLALARLNPGGRLVMTFVTLENLTTALTVLKTRDGKWDVTQIHASRSKPVLNLHRMRAENPVWIVCAEKESK